MIIKEKMSKILAFMLSFAMLAGIVPQGVQPVNTASAIDAGTSVEFDFAYKASELQTIAENFEITYSGATSINDKAMYLVDATSYERTGRNWKFLTYPADAWTGVATKWGGRLSFSGNGTNLYLDSTNRWVAFMLKIEDAADYNVALNYKTGNCGISEVYMFPKPADTSASGIAACLTEENSLGTFDGYGATAIEDSAPLKGINVKNTGEYVVVFRGTGTKNAASTAFWSFVRGLTLTAAEAELSFEAEKSVLEYGKTVNTSYTFKDLEGQDVSGDEYTISYKSSDDSIATVDGTGVITAKGAGNAVIYAIAEYKNSSYVQTVRVTVKGIAKSAEFNFVYSEADLKELGGGTAVELVQATDYSKTGRNWKFLTYPTDAWTGAATKWNGRIGFSGNGMNLYLDSASRWAAFTLNIEDTADYNVELNHKNYYRGGISEVYMFPKPEDTSVSGIEAYLTEENLLGTFDCWDEEPTYAVAKSTQLKGIKVEDEGEYVLVFRGTGTRNANSTANDYFSVISSLELTVAEAELGFEAEKSVLEYGKTVNTSYTFKDLEGQDIPENEYTISYKSSNDSIVTVNEAGVITAEDAGKAVVYAIAEYRDKYYADIIAVTVKGDSRAVEYNFLYSIGDLADVAADKLERPNDGSATDKQAQAMQLVEATSYELTGRNWSFLTYPADAWSGAKTAWGNRLSFSGNGMNLYLETPKRWVAFALNIENAAEYNLMLNHKSYSGGGISEVYMFPMPEEVSEDSIEACLTEENLKGEFDGCDGKSAAVDCSTPLKAIKVEEPGEYVLVLRGTGRKHSASTGYFSLVGSLVLKATDGEFSFEAEKDVIEYGTDVNTSYTFKNFEGQDIPKDKFSVSYKSSDDSVATVDEAGVITAKGVGEAVIYAIAEYKKNHYLKTVTVRVEDHSLPVSAIITAEERISVRQKSQISFEVEMESGNVFKKTEELESIRYVVKPEGIVEIDENNVMVGLFKGIAEITALFTANGKTVESNTVTVEIVSPAKQGLSIYTEEERENILYNVANDSTTRKTANGYAKTADKFVENLDFIYENMIVAEGLPRLAHVGKTNDPNRYNCKYCGCAINKEYATYGWVLDSFNSPWKIQCPDCRRKFPTNDFGSYYKLGLNERGEFVPELAKERHIEMFGGLHGCGYLKNDMYPEMGDTWGVDDGFGYIYTYQNEKGATVTEQHNYIAYYLHFMWYGAYGNKESVQSIIQSLANAYLYTGDIKYGRAGAILLDRIADFYPDFDWYQWRDFRADASGYRGTILDPIWSCDLAQTFAEAYDVFYPVYSDEYVLDYLNEKSEKYDMYPKNSAEMIRKNVEAGLLEAIFQHAQWGNLYGNFGMHQNAVIAAAVAYNNPEKSKEMLDWVMRAGSGRNVGEQQDIKGGNILPQLVEVVDRDGMGTESSPSYNGGWIGYLRSGAEYLKDFELYPVYDLYENPKFLKMFNAQIDILMGGYYTAQIGDTDAFAGTAKSISPFNAKFAFMATGDPIWAQVMYLLNGNKADGLRYPDTVKNPASLADDVLEVIRTHGTISQDSSFMSGYGLYALRDGRAYANSNTTRDFWMYTGVSNGHGHQDSLNIGIDAYGLNMAPDLGYPKATGTEPNRIQWVNSTIAHNTVVVDNKSQTASADRGTPLHFDDSGKVKVMDAERSTAYSQTDIYRRTVVMVEVDDQVSYGVDFFRIVGGNDHMYSFHSQSNTISETEGLELIPAEDPTNTYAGFKYNTYFAKGPDPHPNSGSVWYANDLTYPAGFTWMDNVTSDAEPDKQFAVDFKITDFRNVLKDSSGLQLRMTMMNDFDLSEVTVLNGYPVDNYKNPDTEIKYVLARRTGKNLETLFTTVFEPYKNTRYIDSMTAVPVTYATGDAVAADAPVKAVKVVHKDNRIDYIVYAADNSIEYTVDGLFNFKGFVGVVTYGDANNDGVVDEGSVPVYNYLNDGTVLADTTDAIAAYTGTLESVTEGLTLDNRLVVNINGEISDEAIADLAKRVIYVNNDGKENGGYQILSATRIEDSRVELNIGDVTPVRAYVDSSDIDKGFVYNIKSGQTFRIPVSHVTEQAPTLGRDYGEYSVAAGSKLAFNVLATSATGKALTYESVVMPRGASFDAETGRFSWSPDKYQVGEHNAAIKVSDGTLSKTYNAVITVYKSTGGSEISGNNGGASSGSGSGGGASGGGAGGGSSSDDTSEDTAGDSVDAGGNTDDVGDGVLDVPSEKFIDLGNHTWAKDSIYALVEKGVVNGTSESTYSPAANIKRADFAIMLVRAFGITEGEGENFADVDAFEYYAEQLRLAKVNGIVNGVGENKFNPEGEITRQDMMLMLYRALVAKGYELDEADARDLAQFADSAQVSEYAQDAVASMVKGEYVAGSNGKINPLGRATRAEVAVLLGRIFLDK